MILAVGENGELGKDNKLLWRKQKADMEFFKEMTLGKAAIGPEHSNSNAVIMGRNTWESIPAKFRPLPDRVNIVVSGTLADTEGAIIARSMDEALNIAEKHNCEEAFLIGGRSIYMEGLAVADKIALTIIHHSFPDADVRMPEVLDLFNFGFKQVTGETNCFADENNQYPYTFVTFERDNSWIKVNRYFERDTKVHSDWDWKSEYEKLLDHHRKETQFLLRHIQKRNVQETLTKRAKEIEIFEAQRSQMQAEIDEMKKRDKAVLDTVRQMVSPEMFECIDTWLRDGDNGIWGDLKIVDKPVGDYQEEEGYGLIKGMWIDQSAGLAGDDWSGTLTIMIGDGEYLQACFCL